MAKDLLDLHGYSESDVFDAVDDFLYTASQRGQKRVRIMTGKGKGIVKKKVIDYLKKAKYHWSYEKNKKGQVNEGVLVIFVDD